MLPKKAVERKAATTTAQHRRPRRVQRTPHCFGGDDSATCGGSGSPTGSGPTADKERDAHPEVEHDACRDG